MADRAYPDGVATGTDARRLVAAPAEVAPHASIDLYPADGQAPIPAENFGFLLEAIGTSIYDGVWVGEDSAIANVDGIRKSLIEHLSALAGSLIRWPGGCFASAYDWRDGTGPRAQRPRRTSMWSDRLPADVPVGPQRFDPNQFGTAEFMALCRLTGHQPFLCANTRSLGAYEFDRWVEYCNSPEGSTTLADVRAADGSPRPYDVQWWSVGNEPWGLDGAMTAEHYADTYKRFVTMVPDYGVGLKLVGAGAPLGKSLAWVETLLAAVNATCVPTKLHAVSVHHYAGFPLNDLEPGDSWKQRLARSAFKLPDAVSESEADFYRMLAHYDGIEEYLTRHWAVMEAFDPDREVTLAVDEWGAICAKGTQLSSANYWSRAVTLRDVLGTALSLDVFNRHADKVASACFTGLINQEGGLFLADGEDFVPTGIYHVFALYSAHADGFQIPARFACPDIEFCGEAGAGRLWGLNGSASRKGDTVTLTVVNPSLTAARTAQVRLHGATAASGSHRLIAHHDIAAQNSFGDPHVFKVTEQALDANGERFTCELPPGSVNRITLELERCAREPT